MLVKYWTGRWRLRHRQRPNGEEAYFHYANCPKRPKHYGKNHVVLSAQVQ